MPGNDRFTVRAVVLALASFAHVALVLTAWLINSGRPAEAVAVVSGAMGVALGALGTLLARTSVEPSSSSAKPEPPAAQVAPVAAPTPAPVAAAS